MRFSSERRGGMNMAVFLNSNMRGFGFSKGRGERTVMGDLR